jgi:hypothetical protein
MFVEKTSMHEQPIDVVVWDAVVFAAVNTSKTTVLSILSTIENISMSGMPGVIGM